MLFRVQAIKGVLRCLYYLGGGYFLLFSTHCNPDLHLFRIELRRQKSIFCLFFFFYKIHCLAGVKSTVSAAGNALFRPAESVDSFL